MALSDRIRPDCEAAPWVIKEVKEMESEIKRLKAENARYREALELIIKQFPKDYEVRITEIAREALKRVE